MNFNFDNDRPIYIQLVDQLKLYIVNKEILPGDRLPSVRELALQTKVNPNTMQRALMELENDELIYTERTNGKYITKNKILIEQTKKEMAVEKIKTYLFEMEKLGINKNDAIKYLEEMGGK